MNINRTSRFTQWLLIALSVLTMALSGWCVYADAKGLVQFPAHEPVQLAGPVGDNGGG